MLRPSLGCGTVQQPSRCIRLRPRCLVVASVSPGGPSGSGSGESSGARSSRPGQPRKRVEKADVNKPAIEELIVVEGPSDARVVQRAVSATVFPTNGTLPANPAKGYQMAPAVITRLREAAAKHPGVIVLSDPDLGGRLMRRRVEELLAPRTCRHAFVSADDATCLESSGYKEEGDLGIEFAKAAIVRAAILAARDSTAARAEFTKDDLVRWRLAGEHGKPPPVPDEVEEPGGGERYLRGIGERRDLVGLALGFGACGDGAQFLKQLNRYGFARGEVDVVVEALDSDLVAAPLEDDEDAARSGEAEEEEGGGVGGDDARAQAGRAVAAGE